ncbi:MAG: DNA primase [Syntrophomonadaceae bacterium]
MTKYKDDQLIQEIQARLNIVDIIGETVQLTRKGNRYWGLCPFHQEKTSSFCVTPDKNMFYCFGCHTGGDMFSFLMKRDGVDFAEALRQLAARAGLVISSSVTSKQRAKSRQFLEINNAAADFYFQELKNNKEPREYLFKRGIDQNTIEIFKLGYAPDNWNKLNDFLLNQGFSLDNLKLSGLVKVNENANKSYDLFRNRIIFPIFSYTGDIIAFGGRVLGNQSPKYLNSPETEVYQKRRNLYGLYQAGNYIREYNEAILVEGYMDCLRLYQADIKNVVASLGTAFTREQARLLHRYAQKVLILYDGDAAGQRETLRAGETLHEEGLEVFAVTLPLGQDPDEYLQNCGKKEFLEYIQNNKLSYIEYKIERNLDYYQELTLNNKIQVIKAVQDNIDKLNSEIAKDYLVRVLARKLQLEENLIRKELRIGQLEAGDGTIRNKNEFLRDNIKYGNNSLEEKILATMAINKAVLLKVKDRIGLRFFSREEYNNLAQLVDEIGCWDNDNPNKDELWLMAAERGLTSCLARMLFIVDEGPKVSDIDIDLLIKRVENSRRRDHFKKILAQISRFNIEGDFEGLLKFILELDSMVNTTTREGGKK